jgi:hypothetical protein
MAEIEKDEEREYRILNEAIVDAYGPEEQALGWYYYPERKMQFPFKATCAQKRDLSPLRNFLFVLPVLQDAVHHWLTQGAACSHPKTAETYRLILKLEPALCVRCTGSTSRSAVQPAHPADRPSGKSPSHGDNDLRTCILPDRIL